MCCRKFYLNDRRGNFTRFGTVPLENSMCSLPGGNRSSSSEEAVAEMQMVIADMNGDGSDDVVCFHKKSKFVSV